MTAEQKKISQTYRKIMTSPNEYIKFRLVETLDPKMAKEVLKLVMVNGFKN